MWIKWEYGYSPEIISTEIPQFSVIRGSTYRRILFRQNYKNNINIWSDIWKEIRTFLWKLLSMLNYLNSYLNGRFVFIIFMAGSTKSYNLQMKTWCIHVLRISLKRCFKTYLLNIIFKMTFFWQFYVDEQ